MPENDQLDENRKIIHHLVGIPLINTNIDYLEKIQNCKKKVIITIQ